MANPEILTSADQVERKLAAILAADVAGYSRLMESDEAGTLAALSELLAASSQIISQRNGYVANTAGDSILAVFPSVAEALDAAVELQQSAGARAENTTQEKRMLLRIGVHVGDVLTTADNVFGDGVNVAARVQALAEPGGIFVSRVVRDHLRGKTALGFLDKGEHRLKNISRPLKVFQVSHSGSGHSPSDESLGEADATELAFWETVRESQDVAEYEAYLERYPEGQFKALADARVAKLQETPLDESQMTEIELAFWDSVKDSEDRAMFEAYLTKYPDGHFAEIARARLSKA
jgi:class 3 adenylate cyclase